MAIGRPKAPLVLTPDERRELESQFEQLHDFQDDLVNGATATKTFQRLKRRVDQFNRILERSSSSLVLPPLPSVLRQTGPVSLRE